MPALLPSAEVVRRFIDEDFDRHTPVAVLRWADEGPAERLWELPEGLCITGPAPRRFALHVRRHSRDGYAVRLLWDGTQLSWPSLGRADLLGSCLAALLKALGQELWSVLEQPLPVLRFQPRAA